MLPIDPPQAENPDLQDFNENDKGIKGRERDAEGKNLQGLPMVHPALKQHLPVWCLVFRPLWENTGEYQTADRRRAGV